MNVKHLFSIILLIGILGLFSSGGCKQQSTQNVNNICDTIPYSFYFSLDESTWLSEFILTNQAPGINKRDIDFWTEAYYINEQVYVLLETTQDTSRELHYYAFDCSGEQVMSPIHPGDNRDFYQEFNSSVGEHIDLQPYQLWVYYPHCCSIFN